MEIVEGKITSFDEHGMTIYVPASNLNLDRALLRQYDRAQVGLPDGRYISPEQRKKAHALLAEIADWMGEVPEYIKRLMKLEFMADRMNALEKKLFSLSSCDVTTAKEFISYIIDFILRFDVPTRVPLYELCDDIPRYVYACLMNKKCAVCGAKGELHHWRALGIGTDRTETPQLGWPVISLCREHHMEAHSKGRAWLTDTMHLQAVPLTEEIGKVFKLTKKAMRPMNEAKGGK